MTHLVGELRGVRPNSLRVWIKGSRRVGRMAQRGTGLREVQPNSLRAWINHYLLQFQTLLCVLQNAQEAGGLTERRPWQTGVATPRSSPRRKRSVVVLSLPLILSFVRLGSRRLKRLSQQRQRVSVRPQEGSGSLRKRRPSRRTTFWNRLGGGSVPGPVPRLRREMPPQHRRGSMPRLQRGTPPRLLR